MNICIAQRFTARKYMYLLEYTRNNLNLLYLPLLPFSQPNLIAPRLLGVVHMSRPHQSGTTFAVHWTPSLRALNIHPSSLAASDITPLHPLTS